MGITIKPKGESSPLLFDLELVPAVQPAPREVNLTIHPGILKPLRHHFVAGVRAAFDVGQSSWGFTPLIARSFQSGSTRTIAGLWNWTYRCAGRSPQRGPRCARFRWPCTWAQHSEF